MVLWYVVGALGFVALMLAGAIYLLGGSVMLEGPVGPKSGLEATTDDFDVRESPIWKTGYTWYYRVERRNAKPIKDESAKLDYRISLTVEKVEETDKATKKDPGGKEQKFLEVTLRRNGGIHRPSELVWRVGERCIYGDDDRKLFCRGEPKKVTVADKTFQALEWKNSPRRGVFHPRIGFVEIAYPDDDGREISRALEGWNLGEDTGGIGDDEIFTCDWHEEFPERAGFRGLTDEEVEKFEEIRGFGRMDGTVTARPVSLTPGGWADEVKIVTGESSSMVVFQQDGEVVGQRVFDIPAYTVKIWRREDVGLADVLHLVLAKEEEIELVLLHIGDDGANGLTWGFEREMGDGDFYAGFLLGNLEHCYFQLRNRKPDGTRLAADMRDEEGWYEKIGGSLMPKYQRRFFVEETSQKLSEEQLESLLETICGDTDLEESGGGWECDSCPDWTQASGGDLTIEDYRIGSFSSAGRHEAVVGISGCASDAKDAEDATLLLRESEEEWTPVDRQAGRGIDGCWVVPMANGTSGLMCPPTESEKADETSIYTAMWATDDGLTPLEMIRVYDSGGDCRQELRSVRVTGRHLLNADDDGPLELVLRAEVNAYEFPDGRTSCEAGMEEAKQTVDLREDIAFDLEDGEIAPAEGAQSKIEKIEAEIP